jgi:hypothetical protein
MGGIASHMSELTQALFRARSTTNILEIAETILHPQHHPVAIRFESGEVRERDLGTERQRR